MDFEKSIYKDMCAFESQMDAIVFSQYVTESEDQATEDNIFIRIAKKIKEIIGKIAGKIQSFLSSILKSSAQLISDENDKRINEGLNVIKQAASSNANFAKEVNTWLSEQKEYYSAAKKYVVVRSAKLPEMSRNIESIIRFAQGGALFDKKGADEVKKLQLAASKMENHTDYTLTGSAGYFTIDSMFNVFRMKKGFNSAKDFVTSGINKTTEQIANGDEKTIEKGQKVSEKVGSLFDPIRKAFGVVTAAKRLSNVVAGIKVNRQAKQQRDTAVSNLNIASREVANISSQATALGAKLSAIEKEAYEKDYKTLLEFVNKFEPKAREVLGNRNNVQAQLEDRKKFAEDQIKTKKDIRREKREGKFEEA